MRRIRTRRVMIGATARADTYQLQAVPCGDLASDAGGNRSVGD